MKLRNAVNKHVLYGANECYNDNFSISESIEKYIYEINIPKTKQIITLK